MCEIGANKAAGVFAKIKRISSCLFLFVRENFPSFRNPIRHGFRLDSPAAMPRVMELHMLFFFLLSKDNSPVYYSNIKTNTVNSAKLWKPRS